ncbi:tol-pal system protein YbgF [Salipiger sp. P9]|uniref:tol-pal system protein YbgF n=1 Tax=Salipiger pentaromativorans TaxID=2943193 RepID=UPI0021580ED2|nr:tol-pal system protein YbgF [Salipiger pentaromativorans]MCR8549334.1 tol-pal system protein YbgF [Salipiger pentaromativorans]
MRRTALALCLSLAATGVAAQQTETLADIRQDLTVLTGELQRLKQELNTTGISDLQVSGGTLDRVNAIEAELQRLTARTEELGHRIDRVVQDGSNRVGDLTFRLCELEPGCDIGALGDTPLLGGEAPATVTAPAPAPQALPSGGAELAIGEQTDYRRAQEALASGDFQGAANQFAAFRETFPGSPLEAGALVGEGRALTAVGDTREAARRFLNAYANYPDSEAAPEALWRLGASLGTLGSLTEACVTLGEVAARYPDSAAVTEAQAEMGRLNCP